uniref:Uncharacterized protein n=1 Tax=Avena sativa TaxID=4498 RepID=A0ACD6ALF9_AVESA
MTQAMCLTQVLVLLVLYSYRSTAISWSHDAYYVNDMQIRQHSFWNHSRLLTKANEENIIDHYAIISSNTDPQSILLGGMATLDVYGVENLSNNKIIGSHICVINQQGPDLSSHNAVVAGWMVNPSYFGDSRTHFFTQWTADGYHSTGCYDTACAGFVLVKSAPINPGAILDPIDGQLKITLKIFKNKDDGNWWLHIGRDNHNLTAVGYWPKSIFNNLQYNANYIQWGGHTASILDNASPPMGNGHWPKQHAASVRDVRYVDASGTSYGIDPWPLGLRAYVSHKKCYDVSYFLNEMFYYGGPGGCTK